MTNLLSTINANGFATVENIYTPEEVNAILQTINKADFSQTNFKKAGALFAIRQFFKEVPAVLPLVLNPAFLALVTQHFGADYFIIKSIYFDKPGNSNWFVALHQDLTISVDKKVNLPGFINWTVKQRQFAVQPPENILTENITFRIHLDATTEENGALKVIPGSHLAGVVLPKSDMIEAGVFCPVKKGGVMLMRPLLQHASHRTTNAANRRVIHIELSNQCLPDPLLWSEEIQIFQK